MLKLVTPDMPITAESGAELRSPVSMHCRFEVNFIVDEIVGRRPTVRILEIAWQDKRQHIRQFLLDFYARRHRLPLGRHDLGSTSRHHLTVGVINFTEVRNKVSNNIQRRSHGWRHRLLLFFGL